MGFDQGKMTFDFTREKMFKIWGGYSDMHRVLKPLHFLFVHMHPAKFLASLDFLIAQGLVSNRFVDFYMGDCKGSNLELQRYLLQKVEKVSKAQLIAGKDVIV